MTPKEKAKELFYKMRKQTCQYQEYAGAKYTTCEIGYEAGKKCALIVVDEIINSNPTIFYEEIIENIGYTAIRECNSNYWEEVKQEITNC
jgi:hypothetical protein